MRQAWQKSGLWVVMLALWGCAQQGNLEKSIAPDPSLSAQAPVAGQAGQGTKPKLPDGFPVDIPLYPQAKLMQSDVNSTVWAIADDVTSLEAFYVKAFADQQWKIVAATEPAPANVVQLLAEKNQVEVTVSFSKKTDPAPKTSAKAVIGTTFVLSYRTITAQAEPKTTEPPTTEPTPAPDSAQVSEPAADLIALGIFEASEFKPEAIITRRLFARWLLQAHNKLWGDRPDLQIRLATSSSKPLFTDVPASDPDFAIIQGLAEAGLIASSLTNDTNTTFKPDAPLTRETLIAWKVPLDRRQALPKTSLENIAETWGFQDAAKIETRAIQALYVDFQNGDQANVRRIFGYTTLFQPKKEVTQQEAAIALSYFGYQGDGISAADALKPAAKPKPEPKTP